MHQRSPSPKSAAPPRPPDRPHLLGLTPVEAAAALDRHFGERGQPRYRTAQLLEWIFAGALHDPDRITTLPRSERKALTLAFRTDEPVADRVAEAADGTVKHLWALADGEVVESVLIPAGNRLTLCISSQAGCALGCRFCATGWSGFARQLTAAEIVGQYRASARWAREHNRGAITNVVFMGMGEPLANRKAVFAALTLLNGGYRVGARRITVSTVGVIPGIEALARRPEQFRLALSLHAPLSELRARIVPLEKRYPLDALMDALAEFNRRGGRRVTFEYTLIQGLNDDLSLIAPLAALARRVQAFVNLIPFNPIPDVEWRPSRPERIRAFGRGLEEAGIAVAVREPRGRDIDAACGQLRARAVAGIPRVGGSRRTRRTEDGEALPVLSAAPRRQRPDSPRDPSPLRGRTEATTPVPAGPSHRRRERDSAR